MQSTVRRVVVTGLGFVSPLGSEKDLVWSNLLRGVSGIKSLSETHPEYATLSCRVAGLVPQSSIRDEVNENNDRAQNQRRMSRFSSFGLTAARKALADSKWELDTEHKKISTGVCFGSGLGGIIDVEAMILSYYKSRKKLNPMFIMKILVSFGSGNIAQKLGVKGINHSVSTACATGTHSIGDAMRFIKNGDVDIVIAGSGEASISPLIISAFSAVNSLSTKYNDFPEMACRPFDSKRDGFVMSEGAVCLILEELEHAVKRNANIYAEIVGYGLSSDTFSSLSPDPSGSGAKRSMQNALNSANLLPCDIDYVNAHATGTKVGDLVELKAISNLFENRRSLKVSSTKGSTGHLLGASGAMEAAFTVLSIKHDTIPPMINFDEADREFNNGVSLVGRSKEHFSINCALSNSFGFGGTNSTIIFKKFNH